MSNLVKASHYDYAFHELEKYVEVENKSVLKTLLSAKPFRKLDSVQAKKESSLAIRGIVNAGGFGDVDSEQIAILSRFCVTDFPELNASEVKKAFKMYASGKLEVPYVRKSYLGIQDLGTILSEYRKWHRRAKASLYTSVGKLHHEQQEQERKQLALEKNKAVHQAWIVQVADTYEQFLQGEFPEVLPRIIEFLGRQLRVFSELPEYESKWKECEAKARTAFREVEANKQDPSPIRGILTGRMLKREQPEVSDLAKQFLDGTKSERGIALCFLLECLFEFYKEQGLGRDGVFEMLSERLKLCN